MINGLIFFSFVLLTSVSTIFNISTNKMFVRRTFQEMPGVVLKRTIIPFLYDGTFKPHFEYAPTREAVIDYLKVNLKGKVKSFEIGVDFYTFIDGNLIYTQDEPDNVTIHFRCNIGYSLNYDGYRDFSIEEFDYSYE